MSKAKTTREPVCLLQVNAGRWCQESYETASGDAARRAKALRAAGYRVHVSAMGSQVTSLGLLKLSMVDIRPGEGMADLGTLPAVKVDRI